LTRNFGWDGRIFDSARRVINGCDPEKATISSSKDYVLHCALLKNDMTVHIIQGDSLKFNIGTQT
jgi:hypothetical protein